MMPGMHAYYGPVSGYVPAAAPATYIPRTPAQPGPMSAYTATPPPRSPYVQQGPYVQQPSYNVSPNPPAMYFPSPPTTGVGHVPSPPRGTYHNLNSQPATYYPSPLTPAHGHVHPSPHRGRALPPPELFAAVRTAPVHYTPAPRAQTSLPNPVAPAHPGGPSTPNAAFWPPSPPLSSTPAVAYVATPDTSRTTYTPIPATPARSRSQRRSPHPGNPAPPSSHRTHTPLPALTLPIPLAYPTTPAVPTPSSLFIPSPWVGTPLLPAAAAGNCTAGQILQAEVGYPTPGSEVWADTRSVNWPPGLEEIQRLRHQGVVRSGEIILAPWLIPNPNDVDQPILNWDLATEPTTSAMRVTSRGAHVRVRADSGIWNAPIARGVSGDGKIGWVVVQVVKGGNRDDCIEVEFEVGSDVNGEVTIGELITELHEWSRSPLNPHDVFNMRRDEPTRYKRICQYYHARVQRERGGSDTDGTRFAGEGLRVCDALEGETAWWGAWVHYVGDGGWVLRVGLCDV